MPKQPPRIILLDSCAYFRLAYPLHPLLACPFGPPPPFALRVLDEVDDEYFSACSRLKNKFEWMGHKGFKQDREANRYQCKGKVVEAVDNAMSFLLEYVKQNRFELPSEPSREDLRVLAVGYSRGFPVVSDDTAILDIALVFEIECWTSLDLLKRMHEHNHIAKEKIRQIVDYWHYSNDLPCSREKIIVWYHSVFNEELKFE